MLNGKLPVLGDAKNQGLEKQVQYLQPSPLFSITPNNFPTFISHKKLKK